MAFISFNFWMVTLFSLKLLNGLNYRAGIGLVRRIFRRRIRKCSVGLWGTPRRPTKQSQMAPKSQNWPKFSFLMFFPFPNHLKLHDKYALMHCHLMWEQIDILGWGHLGGPKYLQFYVHITDLANGCPPGWGLHASIFQKLMKQQELPTFNISLRFSSFMTIGPVPHRAATPPVWKDGGPSFLDSSPCFLNSSLTDWANNLGLVSFWRYLKGEYGKLPKWGERGP